MCACVCVCDTCIKHIYANCNLLWATFNSHVQTLILPNSALPASCRRQLRRPFLASTSVKGAVGGGRGNLCADNPFSHPHCLNLSCLRFYGRFISWSYASFPCSSTLHSLLSSFAAQSDQGKWQPQSRQLHCADKPRSLISHSLPPSSLPLSSLFLPLFHHPSLAPLTPRLAAYRYRALFVWTRPQVIDICTLSTN